MFAADCPIFKHRLIVNVFAYLTEVTHPYKLKRSHLHLKAETFAKYRLASKIFPARHSGVGRNPCLKIQQADF